MVPCQDKTVYSRYVIWLVLKMVNPNAETYVPGDILKKTPFYESTYPHWKVTEGEVVSVTKSKVKDINLGKDEKPLYRARYGFYAEYPIFSIFIKADGQIYEVSQLGFNKDGT